MLNLDRNAIFTIHFQRFQSNLYKVLGQEGYPVSEFELGKLDPAGRHIPAYLIVVSASHPRSPSPGL